MHSRASTPLLILVLGTLACADDDPKECVIVDQQLADPPSRLWCDGEYSPPPWDGRVADKSLAVCLPPQADGSCKLCPRDEVVAEVEVRMLEIVEQRQCELEHWEFGCMRTTEQAELINVDGDVCCFQVGLWGQGCEDELW